MPLARQSAMKKRVDKPIEILVGEPEPEVTRPVSSNTNVIPITDSTEQAIIKLALASRAWAEDNGFRPRAVVCRRNCEPANPLNWGVVITLVDRPTRGEIKPVGIRWSFNPSSVNSGLAFHRPEELYIIHEAVTLKDIEQIKRPIFDEDDEALL